MSDDKPPSYAQALKSRFWRDAKDGLRIWWRMTIQGVIGLIATVFAVSFVKPETLAEKGGIAGLALIVTLAATALIHLLWSWATSPRKLYYEQRDQITELKQGINKFRDNVQNPPQHPVPAQRPVEKERAINNGRQMIQELIDSAPPITPLDRKAVAKWRDRCVATLKEIVNDETAWQKVWAALYGAEEIDSAQEVKDSVARVVIQLRALHGRYDHTLVLRRGNMTEGEYNAIYPYPPPEPESTAP